MMNLVLNTNLVSFGMTKGRVGVHVRVGSALRTRLKVVAAQKEQPMAELVASYVEAGLVRDEARIAKRAAAATPRAVEAPAA
jgi:hypothetical protein